MKQEYDFAGAKRGVFRRASGPIKLPASRAKEAWQGPQDALGRFVRAEARETLEAYRARPHLVAEHANQEYDAAQRGHAHRLLYELIQNGADALGHAGSGQTILVRLTERFLYCADDGKPMDEDGVRGLMLAHTSGKMGTAEIGGFRMGFKSVLGVSDTPEFYSRAVSVRFNKARAAERIGKHIPAKRYPTLRLPAPIDAETEAADDDDLGELMSWATNIVRLPLDEGAFNDLATQVQEFPPEFLLFVPHVRYLTLERVGEPPCEFTLHHDGETLRLDTGAGSSRWQCYKTTHTLSDDARADSRTLDDIGDVQLAWAAPLDRPCGPGHFWALLPMQMTSPLAGILKAPWKTNEDTQNLLAGTYNDELIDAAARMVADALPSLATPKDPAKHLDDLLRREAAGDRTHNRRLREGLHAALAGVGERTTLSIRSEQIAGRGAVRDLVVELLMQRDVNGIGLRYAEIARRVRERIPSARTSAASVACYKQYAKHGTHGITPEQAAAILAVDVRAPAEAASGVADMQHGKQERNRYAGDHEG